MNLVFTSRWRRGQRCEIVRSLIIQCVYDSLSAVEKKMQSLIARSFNLSHQLRDLYNNARRCLALSVTQSSALNVCMNADECVQIKWSTGSIDEYPYIYLRENCRCPVCCNDERKTRTMYTPKDVDLDITAEFADWNTEHNQLEVKWGDGHTSNYSLDWLKHLRYDSRICVLVQSFPNEWKCAKVVSMNKKREAKLCR